MKTLMTTAAALVLMTGAAAAQNLTVEEFLAMSNNSAAELMVNETSMGDLTAAEISIALGNMSAAERETFFEADMQSRMEIVDAQMKLLESNSPAESN